MGTSDLNCILLHNQELHTGKILFCFFFCLFPAVFVLFRQRVSNERL